MRRVKSHLRASMSASRTSDLTLITVERELSGAIYSMILDQPLTNLQAWAHADLPLNEYTVLSVVTVSYLLRILYYLVLHLPVDQGQIGCVRSPLIKVDSRLTNFNLL